MDFIILKVNGKDVSKSSHDEALAAFLSADEPITVEVLRRLAPSSEEEQEFETDQANSKSGSKRKSMISSHSMVELKQQQQQQQQANPSHRQSIAHDAKLKNDDNSLLVQEEEEEEEEEDEEEDLIHYKENFEEREFREIFGEGGDLLVPDLDYEEVTLRRSGSSADERFGLTLCYEQDAEDGLTDIFIDDIHPDGLAALDGRLRLGDQIVQINGEDIRTKAQAQEIFVKCKGDVSLLVARPPPHYNQSCQDLVFYEDSTEEIPQDMSISPLPLPPDHDNNNGECNGRMVTSKSPRCSTESADSGMKKGNVDEYITSQSSNGSNSIVVKDKKSRKASSSSQDSGHRSNEDLHERTSAGSSNASSLSYKKKEEIMNLDKELCYVDKKLSDIKKDCESMSAQFSSKQLQQHHYCNEPIYETIPEVSESEDQLYCLPVDHVKKQNHRKSTSFSPEHKLQKDINEQARGRSGGKFSGINRLIRSTSLNKYDKNKNEMESVVEENFRQEKIKEVEQWLKSTCDQHTAVPLSQNQITNDNKSGLKLTLARNNNSDKKLYCGSTLSLVKPDHPLQQQPKKKRPTHPHQKYLPAKMPLKGTMPRPHSMQPLSNNKNGSVIAPTDIMYTNMENLQDTMRLQQEILMRQTNDQRQNPVFQAPPPPPPLTATPLQNVQNGSSEWEWKVKIRPDGTRYITRRPARNRLLKERAQRLNLERSSGMTTDDDNVSELKFGRYWTRDEKRQHLEQAKERKKKQMGMVRAKNELLNVVSSAAAPENNKTKPTATKITSVNGATTIPSLRPSSSSHNMKRSQSVEPVLLSVTTV